jgi:hypothetical protein
VGLIYEGNGLSGPQNPMSVRLCRTCHEDIPGRYKFVCGSDKRRVVLVYYPRSERQREPPIQKLAEDIQTTPSGRTFFCFPHPITYHTFVHKNKFLPPSWVKNFHTLHHAYVCSLCDYSTKASCELYAPNPLLRT